MLIVVGIAAVLLYEIIFLFCHLRPLTEAEIERLACRRKDKYIRKYFTFGVRCKLRPDDRSRMDKSGGWEPICMPTREALAYLSLLLKYKRHEWWVIVLADEKQAKWMWTNKGDDNQSCYFKGSFTDVIRKAKKYQCNTVIQFHNHPHTAERYWDLVASSEEDRKASRAMSDIFSKNGLNFIGALSSRGCFCIYDSCFDGYLPPSCGKEEIRKENGISKWNNYRLHLELRKRIKRR